MDENTRESIQISRELNQDQHYFYSKLREVMERPFYPSNEEEERQTNNQLCQLNIDIHKRIQQSEQMISKDPQLLSKWRAKLRDLLEVCEVLGIPNQHVQNSIMSFQRQQGSSGESNIIPQQNPHAGNVSALLPIELHQAQNSSEDTMKTPVSSISELQFQIVQQQQRIIIGPQEYLSQIDANIERNERNSNTVFDIVYLHLLVRYQLPIIAVHYKNKPTDTKQKVYTILLQKLAFHPDPTQAAKQLFREHSRILREGKISVDKIAELISKIQQEHLILQNQGQGNQKLADAEESEVGERDSRSE